MAWNPPKDYTDADYYYKGRQAVAQQRARQALNNGTLREPEDKRCEVCGKKDRLVMHHYLGYDEPFRVWFVCYRCNANLPQPETTGKTISLDHARKIIRSKYARAEWQPLLRPHKDRSFWDCDVCGLGTSPDVMHRLFINDIEGDALDVCQRCFDNTWALESWNSPSTEG